MYWKGLRIGASDSNDPKRRSVFEPQALSRHSEQLPRPTLSTTNLAPRLSESAPRSPSLAGPDSGDEDGVSNNDTQTPTDKTAVKKGNSSTILSPDQGSNWHRNRFNFMRLRHASDPQLSKSFAKAEGDIPPIPSLPPPPTIITTAPTSNELDEPVKRKPKFKVFPDPKKPPIKEVPANIHAQRLSLDTKPRHGAQGSTGSQTTDLNLSTSNIGGEEPGRLSTTSIRSGSRDHANESHRSSVTDARFSESSRSDQSSGDQGVYRTYSPHEASSSNKRFRMPRLKRNRGPLFPLPPKPTSPQPINGRAPDSISRSVTADPAPALKSDITDDQDQVSPLPSPSRSSVGLASSGFPLLRNDSANSAHSAHSTPSNRTGNRNQTRPRSTTLDSLANIRDAAKQPSPHTISSSRTSTSISGRKSFGDIFSISQRLRQNSEPPTPRNGSPGIKGSDTPVSKRWYPEREEDDSPATYLSRLEESIPKGMIAGVLAQSNDDFYKTALRRYMRRFAFFGDPIDMAIRKLLMGAELPKETQQIDRFLQSFADRYHECNPGIFASAEQGYFIAFSILILHTDVFNKNNKRKMQKMDYVKNTGGEGISNDILACFYENISYTPFIHIEDTQPNGRQLAKPRRPLFKTASSEHLARVSREPVDPYTLILDGKLDSLRPSLKDVMILEDTYRCNGTTGPPDMDSLHHAFTKSGILQILSPRSRPDAFMPASIDNPADSHPGLVDIKVAKVGLLWRKDPKKKRTRSPWQEWGALLTFSQLYFFRDVNWIKSLMSQQQSHQKEGRRRAVVFKPPLTEFKPDAIMSTDDAVALLDLNYKKHKHAFLFVRHNALEEVFLANTEADMNDWLAKLNYAATFRSTGIRTKWMIATGYDAQRNRMSRRGSASSNNSHRSVDKEPPSPNPDMDVPQEVVMARKDLMRQRIREADEKLLTTQKQLDQLLRNARHLQILTPVNSRAREQVIMAAGRIAAKLKWMRQEIWRTKCYREVLIRDLDEGDETKSLAEQKPHHLQVPTTSGSTSEQGTLGLLAENVPSPTQETSPHLPSDEPPLIHTAPLSQVASTDVRRPSIPISVTSSELATRAGRPLSSDFMKERAKSSSPGRASKLEREPSILSAGSKMDVASLGSRASKLTSHVSIDDGEERILRETGLLGVNSSSQARKQSLTVHDIDVEPIQETTEALQGDRMSRIRRSLHRTLRDSGQPSINSRSKKSRDSASSAAVEDDQDHNEEEGLSRKTPSFTVHGKKASIITFGSEWQNMPPEERLKLRKPTSSDEPRASDAGLVSSGDSITSDALHEGNPESLRSASTATKISVRMPVEAEEPKETSVIPDGEDKKAKSHNAIDTISNIPPISAAPLATSPIVTTNGQLAVSTEDQTSPHSTPADDNAINETTPQKKLQSSPPEQAVNA